MQTVKLPGNINVEMDTLDQYEINECEISLRGPLPTLKELKHFLIQEALKKTRFNKTRAAKILGITRQALHNHIRQTN